MKDKTREKVFRKNKLLHWLREIKFPKKTFGPFCENKFPREKYYSLKKVVL